MKVKRFRNLDEQIEILKVRGMIIEDEIFAKDVLLRENYFFLNGYRHLFVDTQNDKKYLDNVHFEEQYSLFLFDRQFRNIIFKHLLIIENNMKSIISYQLSRKYGYKEKDYLKSSNFDKNPSKQRQINDLLKKMKRQVRINGTQHSATSHYINNYGYIPLWVLVKVLSFGIVSEMYSILKLEDRMAIAKIYNIDANVMVNYLSILANYRNLCAHEDILFENRTQRFIDDTVYHRLLDIRREHDEYICGKNDLFALIIIIRQFLTKGESKNLVVEIDRALDNLDYNVKSININSVLKRMGFPENWKEIADIEKKELDDEE